MNKFKSKLWEALSRSEAGHSYGLYGGGGLGLVVVIVLIILLLR